MLICVAVILAALPISGALTASASESKTLYVNWSNIEGVGHQTPYTSSCACFAVAYCRTMLDNKVHYWYEYDVNSGNNGESGAAAQWSKGNFTSSAKPKTTTTLKAVYEQINNGRPAILHVKGGRSTGQHWVAVVGYQNVTDVNNLSCSNFLIIDSVASDYELENLDSLGYSLYYTSGTGYRYAYTSTGSIQSSETSTKELLFTNADSFVAECLAYGPTNIYTGEREMAPIISYAYSHNYTYIDLAEAVIDREHLVFNSIFWQNLRNALDGEFLELENWQEAFYTVLLMEYIKYCTESSYYEDYLLETTVKFSYDIYDNILKANKYIYDLEIDDIIKTQTPDDAVAFSKDYGYVVKLEKYTGIFNDIVEISSTAIEYYQNLSKALAVQEANEGLINYIKSLKNHAGDNPYFLAAIDNIVDYYSTSYSSIAFNESASVMVGLSIECVFDAALKIFPELEVVIGGLNLYTSGLNWMFNSDNEAENNLKLTILYIINSYFSSSLLSLKKAYMDNPTEENARFLNNAFMYFENYQCYASEQTRGFVTSILFDGILNKIENMFSDKNQLLYEDFQKYFDSDVAFAINLCNLTIEYYNAYKKVLDYNYSIICCDEYNSDAEPIEVNKVEFITSEASLFMNYTFFNQAIAYPSYASNRDITYTSSDTSIATISDSGVIKPVNPGTVKMYASTSNGTTGSCTITVLPFYATETDTGYQITKCISSKPNVEIPRFAQDNSIVSIADNAFYENTTTTKVDIPSSVTQIGTKAFFKCSNLTDISIHTENKIYTSENGALFNKEKTELICCPPGKQGEYTVPDNVLIIREEAFFECSKLSKIILSDTVTSVGLSAFKNCSSLTDIHISNNVTTISEYAFENCTSLSSIEIPDSLTNISNFVFLNCTGLKSVRLPETLKSIGNSSFKLCTSLSEINIPPSITFIDDRAFERCYSLTEITLPEGLQIIEDYSFCCCTNLKTVNLPDGITELGDGAFRSCSQLDSIILPEGIKSIGFSAFSDCGKLQSINIPSSVNYIGSYAFYNCSQLGDLFFIEDNIQIGGTLAFYNCNNINLHCGYGSLVNIYAQENNVNHTVFGDFNHDDAINAYDLSQMRKILLLGNISNGVITDCNSDSTVNIKDLISLKKQLVTGTERTVVLDANGITNTFAGAKGWLFSYVADWHNNASVGNVDFSDSKYITFEVEIGDFSGFSSAVSSYGLTLWFRLTSSDSIYYNTAAAQFYISDMINTEGNWYHIHIPKANFTRLENGGIDWSSVKSWSFFIGGNTENAVGSLYTMDFNFKNICGTKTPNTITDTTLDLTETDRTFAHLPDWEFIYVADWHQNQNAGTANFTSCDYIEFDIEIGDYNAFAQAIEDYELALFFRLSSDGNRFVNNTAAEFELSSLTNIGGNWYHAKIPICDFVRYEGGDIDWTSVKTWQFFINGGAENLVGDLYSMEFNFKNICGTIV